MNPAAIAEADFSLFQLLKPELIADPYPLYRKIRELEPVHWDPFMNSWVITSYAEALIVLSRYKAERTPAPAQLEEMGLAILKPYGEVMLKQMLFRDPPAHTRLRSMCAAAFTPARIASLLDRANAIANALIDRVAEAGRMDIIAGFASPFPSRVLSAMMGFPEEDAAQLKLWASDFSELLGNFEHDPDRIGQRMASLQSLQDYVAQQVAEQSRRARPGVISALLAATGEDRLNHEEIVANAMLMIAGGLEETTNLIGNGLFSLLCRPGEYSRLRNDWEILQPAVEELLRFESPTQHTGRLAPEDASIGGKRILRGQSMTVVLAAANRDPARFESPDDLILTRADNRHVAFGWASHYCLGAPLSRMAGQVAFRVLLERLPDLSLITKHPQWRVMAAMRGISSLMVEFDAREAVRLGST